MNYNVRFKLFNKLLALFFEILTLFMLIMNTVIFYSTLLNKCIYAIAFLFCTAITVHILSFGIDFSTENDCFIYHSVFTRFQKKTLTPSDILTYNITRVHRNRGYDYYRLTLLTSNGKIKITDNNFSNYHEFCEFIKSIK